MARTDTLPHFLTDVADAIRTKAGTSEPIQASSFDTAISNIPSGGGPTEAVEKDVNFYDHTGFRHYSYTKAEFLALDSMPENPTIEGLTAQGWNWSLADAQAYVGDYGGLDIGQTYITDDEKTRLYITLPEERKEPYLIMAVNGTATVNWGDGNTSTITGNSRTTNISTQHIYSTAGDYVITIYPENNSTISFGGSFVQVSILTANKASSTSLDAVYIRTINKIELGKNVVLRRYLLANTIVQSINLPLNTIFDDNGNQFTTCSSLIKCIIYPNGVTDTYSSVFNNIYYTDIRIILPNSISLFVRDLYGGCYSMKKVWLPGQVSRILNGAFNSCYALTHIIVPKNVYEVGGYAFASCYGLAYIDFSRLSVVPTIQNTTFNSLPTDCKLIVPDSLYNDWIVANYWSNYSTQIIKKSDWDAL